MNIPGIKAKHARVSPTCRTNKGTLGAGSEAVQHLMEEYCALADLPANKEANFHFVLTVERPNLKTADDPRQAKLLNREQERPERESKPL